MRTANFPYRRVAALSHLIARHWDTGVFADTLKCLKSTLPTALEKGYTGATRNKIMNFFCLEVDDYWAWHYTPDGKNSLRNNSL